MAVALQTITNAIRMSQPRSIVTSLTRQFTAAGTPWLRTVAFGQPVAMWLVTGSGAALLGTISFSSADGIDALAVTFYNANQNIHLPQPQLLGLSPAGAAAPVVLFGL
jgi:hypothetical protein